MTAIASFFAAYLGFILLFVWPLCHLLGPEFWNNAAIGGLLVLVAYFLVLYFPVLLWLWLNRPYWIWVSAGMFSCIIMAGIVLDYHLLVAP